MTRRLVYFPQVASNGFTFDQLGIRIPTIAISPWIKKNTIVSEALRGEKPTLTSQFDATSILATANKLLGKLGVVPTHFSFLVSEIVSDSETVMGLFFSAKLNNEQSVNRSDFPFPTTSLFAGLTDEGVKPLTERMAWANTFAGTTSLSVVVLYFIGNCLVFFVPMYSLIFVPSLYRPAGRARSPHGLPHQAGGPARDGCLSVRAPEREAPQRPPRGPDALLLRPGLPGGPRRW